MRVTLAYPTTASPADGVADHTRLLAEALRRQGVQVGLLGLAAEGGAPLPGRGVRRGLGSLGGDDDAVVVQYSPFAYGRWGLRPGLGSAIRHLATRGVRVVVFFHETYSDSASRRHGLMNRLQRRQFTAVLSASHVAATPVQDWVQAYAGLPQEGVHHVPIASNLPEPVLTRADAKRRLGLDDALAVGVFGALEPQRPLTHMLAAFREAARGVQARTHLVYVGTHGAQLARAAGELADRLVVVSAPGPEEASAAICAFDVGLSPFTAGVSARRGSFLALLQHGVPTVTNAGPQTSTALRTAAREGAFFLADGSTTASRLRQLLTSEEDRVRAGERARAFYCGSFSWDAAARQLVTLLSAR